MTKDEIIDKIEDFILSPEDEAIMDAWQHSDGLMPQLIRDYIEKAINDYALSILPERKNSLVKEIKQQETQMGFQLGFNAAIDQAKENIKKVLKEGV